MHPSPAIEWAFVISAHWEILYTPSLYWLFAVLPISANFRSSKIKKLCLWDTSTKRWILSIEKSSKISTWVLSTQICGPNSSAVLKELLFMIQVKVKTSVRQNAFGTSPVRTSLDFPGLSPVFVVIMPDKFILDHKKSYLVSFENFIFFQFLAKIGH